MWNNPFLLTPYSHTMWINFNFPDVLALDFSICYRREPEIMHISTVLTNTSLKYILNYLNNIVILLKLFVKFIGNVLEA